MKLPSLRYLAQESSETLTRFPLAVLSAVIGTAAWITIINHSTKLMPSMEYLYNTAAVGLLGISLGTAVVCFAERNRWPFGTSLLAQAVAGTLLFVYYYSLPGNIFAGTQLDIIRFFLFTSGLHFLVAIAPFIGKGTIDGFWEFNKALFLRFLTAGIYSGVLFAGLAIALAAVDNLFNVDIWPKRYFQLWWFLCGIFNTWFFLNGVPKNFQELDTNLSYPKGLKIFTQYILLPLVIIYVVILYAYFGKIVAEWDWPKGWVGYLVLGFSVSGILSLLLVHPVKEAIENSWIRFVSRWFYVALPPLVILLLLAALRRISEYGMTERRYFLIILGVWLAAISLYFIFSKVKNIKVIPASLFFLSFITSFGPWGAFSISEHNQLGRLEEVLIKNNILVDGKIRAASGEIPFEDSKRINSIIRYICEVHTTSGIQPWFDVSLDSLLDKSSSLYTYRNYNDQAMQIVKLLGIPQIAEWQTEPDAVPTGYTFSADDKAMIYVDGYKYLMKSISLNSSDSTTTLHIENTDWMIEFSAANQTMSLSTSGSDGHHFGIDMKPVVMKLVKQYSPDGRFISRTVPAEEMAIEQEQGGVKIKLLFRTMSYHSMSHAKQLNSVLFDLMLHPGS